MGTWGKGNFYDDDTREFLHRLIAELVGDVRYNFSQTPKYGSLISLYEHKIITALDVLVTLCTQYGAWIAIEAEEAKNWKERYLEVFDEQMPRHAPKEFVEKRRKIIIETFDKVIKLTEEWNNL